MMTRPRVFVTRRIPEEGLRLLQAHCSVELWTEPLPPSRSVLAQRARGAHGLLTMLTDRIDEALLDAVGAQLRVVSNFAVGYDNIDVTAATRRGVPVGHTPGVLTETTADLAFALLMAAARRLVEADALVRTGGWRTWDPTGLLGVDIHGAVLGIIGFGRIGRAVARRALGFNMRVLYYSRTMPHPHQLAGCTPVPLNTLLAEADFISLHTPLTAETRSLINAAAFERMKPSAVLVNTARGAVVDSQALYAALRTHRIFAAALDVTDPEPLPADSPLLQLENLIVSPHIGSASRTARSRMARMAAENLLAGLRGDPLPHCANPQVYASA